MLSFFPRDVLDEILDLIESVSGDFSIYSCHTLPKEINEDIAQIVFLSEVLSHRFLRLNI